MLSSVCLNKCFSTGESGLDGEEKTVEWSTQYLSSDRSDIDTLTGQCQYLPSDQRIISDIDD